MKVISVHSKQGGKGRTTRAISVAKENSEFKKACILDLDFLSLGIRPVLNIDVEDFPSLPFTLEDYFCDSDPHNFPIQDMLIEIDDNFWVAFNLQALLTNDEWRCLSKREDLLEKQEDMFTLIEDESVYGCIEAKLKFLLEKLEEIGFDYVILDCHIGTRFVAGVAMKIVDKENQIWIT